MVKIKDNFVPYLKQAGKRSKGQPVRSFLSSCTVHLQNSVKDMFMKDGYWTSGGFTSWEVQSPVTVFLRKKGVAGKKWHGYGASLLKDSFRLQRELQSHPSVGRGYGSFYVKLSTRDKVARLMDNGWLHSNVFRVKKRQATQVPPRPVYSFSPVEREQLLNKSQQFILGE